jgi:hypothetical protein
LSIANALVPALASLSENLLQASRRGETLRGWLTEIVKLDLAIASKVLPGPLGAGATLAAQALFDADEHRRNQVSVGAIKGLPQRGTLDVANPFGRDAPASASALSPYDQEWNRLVGELRKVQSEGSEAARVLHALTAGDFGDVSDKQRRELMNLAASVEYRRQSNELQKQNEQAANQAAEEMNRLERERILRLNDEADRYRDLLDTSRQYLKDQDKLGELVKARLLTEDEAIQVQRKLFESRTRVEDLGKAADVAADAGRALGVSFTSALDQITFGAKKGIDAMELLRATAADVMKVIYHDMVTQPLSGSIEAMFRGTSSRGNPYASGSMTTESAGLLGQWLHGGGVVGADAPARSGYIHPAYFETAPRFHNGLMPDEFPAVLQKGEGVFTPAQMKAMGGVSIVNNLHVEGNGVTRADVERAVQAGTRATLVAVAEARRR